MRFHSTWKVCGLFSAVMGMASPAGASTITTIPTGLAPGTQYRLAFVTSGTFQATSTDISTYNTYIANAVAAIPALAALPTSWYAIASTSGTDAITNIGIGPGVAIYNLADTEIAVDAGTGASGLFSGGIMANINMTESGVFITKLVWTGSNMTGTKLLPLGAGSQVEVGDDSMTNRWLLAGSRSASNSFPLYGISGILTSPSNGTPEPATTWLFLAAAVYLLPGVRLPWKIRRIDRG